MSETVQVYVFENDPTTVELYGIICEMLGWQIMAVAWSLAEANTIIDDLTADTHAIAFVDRNLGMTKLRDSDGDHIVARLRAKCPRVTIVGATGGDQLKGAHYHIAKEDIVGFSDNTPFLRHYRD